jgi:hypothetical protein
MLYNNFFWYEPPPSIRRTGKGMPQGRQPQRMAFRARRAETYRYLPGKNVSVINQSLAVDHDMAV